MIILVYFLADEEVIAAKPSYARTEPRRLEDIFILGNGTLDVNYLKPF